MPKMEINVWYEKLASPFAKRFDGDGQIDTQVTIYYNSERNIILNKICKNGSSSIEFIGHLAGFQEVSLYSADLLFCTEKPLVITILRDPVDRYISAVNMYVDQLRTMGLKLKMENFTNLEYVTDMHFRPQIGDVLCNWVDEDVMIVDGCIVYNGFQYEKWSDFMEVYPYVDHIEHEQQKFYLMESHTDVVRDIIRDFDFPVPPNVSSWFNECPDHLAVYNRGNMDPELLEYVQNFYKPDYELLNLVKFENKDTR